MMREPTCAAILAIALLGGCSHPPDPQPKQPAPAQPRTDEAGAIHFPPDSPQLRRIQVQEVSVQRVPLEEVIAPGKIEANPNRISRITLPVAGRVLRVMVGIGDSVSQGQPLLTIESPEVGAAISAYRQAQARLGQAKAALLKAESDLTRVQDLYAGRAIAQKEVLNAQAILAQAKADVEQAQAAGDEALRRIQIFNLKPGDSTQEITVRAPLPGKVLEIAVAAGEYRTDTSASLMTIADLGTVFMAADVPESVIRLFTVGEAVAIRIAAYPQEEISGRVVRIADTVDAATRTIRVRAMLSNLAGRFRPEMFGEIRHEENFQIVPVVPAGAIVQSDQRSVAFRMQGPGVFEPVTVTFGKQRDGRVPVTSGLKAGDRIVVDGAMLLRGGR
jgi:cobalt-zinc-cadmium efflux system membrane fusion protein